MLFSVARARNSDVVMIFWIAVKFRKEGLIRPATNEGVHSDTAKKRLLNQRTAAFGFGGKAASVMVPRRRSSASLSARSSFSSGGT
jgi:hypothetical protein